PPHRGPALVAAGVTVLAEAGSAPEAVAAAVAGDPRVVVVDLSGPDALVAIALVVDERPGVAVLAVSRSAEHADVLAAVRAGATGYVVARSEGPVADAVLRLARGEPAYSPGLAAVVLEASGSCERGVRLTDRESDVLALVVDGLTARQIAGRLVLSPRTVENHVHNLLRKLKVGNRAALVRYAIENGLA
ncbi:MAG: response regulator transcription factor, partial [Pseudonocardia sp.]|nr:response regulator transcription factor [Pseudonocardia sp.]